MKKFLKIFLKSLVALILLIIILLITIPYFFKDELLTKVKEEINNNVNAKVDFSDFSLSLISNFPALNMSLNNLMVVGIDKFEGDTLLYFNEFSVAVDVMSVIKDEDIKVKSILLDNPIIFAQVLEDSTANWDIAKPSTDTIAEVIDSTEVDTAATDMNFKIQLKKFEIRNAIISYSDATSDMFASLENFDFLLSGDFSMDLSLLNMETSIERINVMMGGTNYLKDAGFSFKADIAADLLNSVYTFKENELTLNRITLGFDGNVKMPENGDIGVDVTYYTKKTDFKTLLSMVPAAYLADYEGMETTGKLAINGYAKGIYNEKTMPSVGLTLTVEDAMFKYPDLPKSVDNINVDLKVFYDGINDDRTTIDLNKFHLELAENPIDMEMHVRTPMSDPHIKGNVTGKIDLSSVNDAIPMEGMNIKGKIDANLNIEGNMSTIEEERYEEFKAEGKVSLASFDLESKDFPQGVKIIEATLKFSPKYVELASFDSKIGNSDFQLYGKIENYLAYVFKDETIKGELRFNSNLLDLNEFMSEEDSTAINENLEEVEAAEEDSVEMTVFEVPSNVNFVLTSNLKQIKYDKYDIKNTTGVIKIKDSRVLLENLSMDLLQGSMILTGQYNTQDMSKPFVDFDYDIKEFDIQETAVTFNTVEKFMPLAKKCKGKFSMKLNMKTFMDEHMEPIMESVNGYGKMQSNKVEVVDSKALNKIADQLKLLQADATTFRNLNISFTIADGRINVEPFNTKVGNMNLRISGNQGLDQTMDYNMDMKIPRKNFGSAANSALNSLVAAANSKGLKINPGEFVNVKAKVVGTVTEPKVKLDLKKSGESSSRGVKDQVKEQLKQKAKEEAAKQKKELERKAKAEMAKKKKELKEKARIEAEKKKKELEEKAKKALQDKLKKLF